MKQQKLFILLRQTNLYMRFEQKSHYFYYFQKIFKIEKWQLYFGNVFVYKKLKYYMHSDNGDNVKELFLF